MPPKTILFCLLILVALALATPGHTAPADDFTWTWIKGQSRLNQVGVYGTRGLPNAANNPGARTGSVSWIDPEDNLWLFGGQGVSATSGSGYLNDLWKYDPASGNWTWMNGSTEYMQPEVYGNQGVYGIQGTPGEANTPGGRTGCASWTDADGNLWLFGGYIYYITYTYSNNTYMPVNHTQYYNDLWKYDRAMGMWIWMQGSSTENMAGAYGTAGQPDLANTPGARKDALTWTDSSGALWLLGGHGLDTNHDLGYLNDLWKYDPNTNTWTWLNGSPLANSSAVYGLIGVPAAVNTPGAFRNAITWLDADDVLWLFGGYGYNGDHQLGTLNALWKYDPVTNRWAWMKGSQETGSSGVYGTMGMADASNTPRARDAAASWIDAQGKFWLFGGEILNDLWTYDPTTNNWTWMKGSAYGAALGVYGTLGSPDIENTPGARNVEESWPGADGKLWFFGGEGINATDQTGELNDLWVYDPLTNKWTWMSGSSSEVDLPGTYGIQGVPDETSNPGARDQAITWTDSDGNLWLFGGNGFDATGQHKFNDLWKYNHLTGKWTWIKGPSSVIQHGIYGTLRTPAPDNNPGGLYGATVWTGKDGGLWLFGGYGCDITGYQGILGSLWRYDRLTGNWTWMSGAPEKEQPGTYGTLGESDKDNCPGARVYAASWVDKTGCVWLFGGDGYDTDGNRGYLNDLWKYDPVANRWTWIKGSSLNNQAGVYGVLGEPDPDNTPGGRASAVCWIDAAGNLWLFGGTGCDLSGNRGFLNDLWKYDPVTNCWTWMKGAETRAATATWGSLGVPDPANAPGARMRSTSWIDAEGNLWLFGGYGEDELGHKGRFNDLWRYDRTSGNWTWMKGSTEQDQIGIYGTRGVPDPANTPGARDGAITWTDVEGHLWLFGGYGYDAVQLGFSLGDLWKYDPASGNWTWVKGASTGKSLGIYGIQGIPDVTNVPGARSYSCAWTDPQGNLWLYGGTGCDAVDNNGVILNDLWVGVIAPGNSTGGSWLLYR